MGSELMLTVMSSDIEQRLGNYISIVGPSESKFPIWHSHLVASPEATMYHVHIDTFECVLQNSVRRIHL